MTTEGSRPAGFDPQRDVMLDARNLRGLAHPLRARMLGILREEGPATSTMLARRLGESSAATSYHLRRLAEFGFVEDDPERGHGRERWWRSAHRSTYFNSDAAVSQETALLGTEYLRNVVRGAAARMEAWVDALPTVDPAWRDVGTMSDYRLLLTPDQARAFIAQLDEIGLAARADGGGSPDPAARPVSFQFQVLPSLHAVLDGEQTDDGDRD
jgi:DNA-binding transcriptional ArsR family regulator